MHCASPTGTKERLERKPLGWTTQLAVTLSGSALRDAVTAHPLVGAASAVFSICSTAVAYQAVWHWENF